VIWRELILIHFAYIKYMCKLIYPELTAMVTRIMDWVIPFSFNLLVLRYPEL